MKLLDDEDSNACTAANGETPEKEIMVSLRNLSLISDKIQQGIWVIDVLGNITYANPFMAALVATTTDDMVGKSIFNFLSKDTAPDLLDLINSQNLINVNTIEFRYRKATGEDCWLTVTLTPLKDNQGNLKGTVALHSEIPTHGKEKNSVHKREVGSLIEGVKDYAIMMVDKKHQILSWNLGAKMIFGYEEDEIVGKKIDTLFTEEDNRNNAPEVELTTASQAGHSFDDRWHVKKDGSVFYASGVMTRLDDGRQSTKFVKIARDWTDRKKLEEMLKKADRHKNEFLATLAHELRNPLASILSGIEVLKQGPDQDKISQTHQIIERQVQQMIPPCQRFVGHLPDFTW